VGSGGERGLIAKCARKEDNGMGDINTEVAWKGARAEGTERKG